jgi:type 1 fimbriae regulatory protein FimB/type 1 fimbriae regulatory protein FimE
MTKGNLRLVSPRAVIGTVPPRRVPNAERGNTRPSRKVERLMKAAKANRRGHRDATMILLAFRHGLLAPPSWLTCDGIRWTWAAMRACTCAESIMACRASIHYKAMKCGHCGR